MVLLLVMAFTLVACGKDNEKAFLPANAYLVIDINPSIEVVTNEDGKVLRVTALNEDAQVLLLDVDFKGKTLDEVVNTIIELARELGYINDFDENAILFTVEAEQERTVEELKKFLEEKVKKFKDKHKIRVQVLIEQLSKNPELIAEARELDISVNKLALIYAAIDINPELTIEEARELPIKDLLRIITEAREDAEGIFDDENLSEFHKNKKLAAVRISLKAVELINNTLQVASDEVFANLLEGNDTTVSQVKALYQEYFDALKAAVESFENDNNEEPGEDDLTEEGKVLQQLIQELVLEKERLEAEIDDLIKEFASLDWTLANFKTLREQLKTELNDLRHDYQEILIQIKEAMKDLSNLIRKEKDKLPGNPGKDPRPRDILRALQAIRQEYEGKFEVLGVELKELEKLFVGLIRNQLEDAKVRIKEEFEEAKENLKERSKEVKDILREKKDTLRGLFGK